MNRERLVVLLVHRVVADCHLDGLLRLPEPADPADLREVTRREFHPPVERRNGDKIPARRIHRRARQRVERHRDSNARPRRADARARNQRHRKRPRVLRHRVVRRPDAHRHEHHNVHRRHTGRADIIVRIRLHRRRQGAARDLHAGATKEVRVPEYQLRACLVRRDRHRLRSPGGQERHVRQRHLHIQCSRRHDAPRHREGRIEGCAGRFRVGGQVGHRRRIRGDRHLRRVVVKDRYLV